MKIGLQLWSIKEETNKDFVAALEKVSQIGYHGVEFAGYGNLSSNEMKAHLDRLNLQACGSHISIEQLTNNLSYQMEYNLSLSNTNIVCPYAQTDTLSQCIELAENLNRIGAQCKMNGLQLHYHNHAHEFTTFDGKYGLDILIEKTDPSLVSFEVDTYWVKFANIDPVAYLTQHADRISLVHMKDMKKDGNGNTEIGNGLLDIKGIYNLSIQNNVSWFIVEQENFNMPVMESVAISFANIMNLK